MKIDFCFHTHTKRCGHATGEDEEYVLAAIEAGITELGFSDHIMYPYHAQPGIRGSFGLFEDYINSVKALQEKYKDKINIYLGLECEYQPEYDWFYKELKDKYHFDYLILGQHCYINKEGGFNWYMNGPNYDELEHYCNDLITAMKTGFFMYVAHPDYVVTPFPSWNSKLEEISHRICKTAAELDMPLEINLGAYNPNNLFTDKMRYPYPRFFEIAAQYKCKVYIGRDAHKPFAFIDNHFDYAVEVAEKNGLEILTRLKK